MGYTRGGGRAKPVGAVADDRLTGVGLAHGGKQTTATGLPWAALRGGPFIWHGPARPPVGGAWWARPAGLCPPYEAVNGDFDGIGHGLYSRGPETESIA